MFPIKSCLKLIIICPLLLITHLQMMWIPWENIWDNIFNNRPNKTCGWRSIVDEDITSNFLKAFVHKFYLFQSWMHCLIIWRFEYKYYCNVIIAPSISEGYQEQNSQYITVLLEQINHLRAENENRTCIIQALVEK